MAQLSGLRVSGGKTLEASSAAPDHYVPGERSGAVSRAVTNRLLPGPTGERMALKKRDCSVN